MRNIKKFLLTIYIILNILYILAGSYLRLIRVITLDNFSKVYIVLLFINVLILLFIYIVRKIKKKSINFKITDIFILLIIIFSIISCIFAIKKDVAIYGTYGRYEGLFSILYYFSIYMLSSYIEKENKKKIVYTILLLGLIETIYAHLQVTQLIHVKTTYENSKPWATGFLINPNFYGTLMLLCISYSIGLFIDSNKLYIKIINGILSFIFLTGILISDTLSALVGLFMIFIYIFIYIIKNKKYKEFIIMIIIFISSSLLIISSDKTVLLHDFIKTKNQTLEMVGGKVEDNYGSNRIYIWRHAIRVVPKYLYTGSGIDNFRYSFGPKPLMVKGMILDKAHNEYLQILVCEGIFCLISYILFYLTILIRGIINSYKDKNLYLILPIIGYLTQAFFNISVIEVAPLFFIALGLVTYREKNKKINN